MRVRLICLVKLLTICFAIQSLAAGSEQITNYSWLTTSPKISGWKLLIFKPDGSLEAQCHPGDLKYGVWREASPGVIKVKVAGDEYLSEATLWFSGNPQAGYEKMDLWDGKSRVGGSGIRKDALNGAAAPTGPAAGGGVPVIAVFAAQLSKAMGWATLPLTNTVPADIRDGIAEIQGGLKDEAARTPQASAQAYTCADLICRNLIFALDDRESTLQQNRRDAAGKLTQTWMSAWDTKSARYRSTLRADVQQFASAIRQSEKPKQPVPAGMTVAVTLPPVPAAAGAQGNDFKPNANNPLDRGAYDRHPAWWAPWWGYYRY